MIRSGVLFETGRILFCIDRNQLHSLLCAVASSSVKKCLFDPFQSYRLLKLTLIILGGMERSGISRSLIELGRA